MKKLNSYSWLALGDSYTIGESVPLFESYPYQTVQRLRGLGHTFQAPEIIAKTGWTSDELINQVKKSNLLSSYDLVTILIGVNNQYRNLGDTEYKLELDWLVTKSISLADNDANKVIIINIPDWSVTPFANGRNKNIIAEEIDHFNSINKSIAAQYDISYCDINTGYRKIGADEKSLVADLLHPSAQVYNEWAESLSQIICGKLDKL